MKPQQHRILILSRDASFCAHCRGELEIAGSGLQTVVAENLGRVRALAGEMEVAVVVLDDRALAKVAGGYPADDRDLESTVAYLAGFAPVVVLAAPERQGEIAALLAAGAADFVARAGNFLPSTLALIERRLQQKDLEKSAAGMPPVRGRAEGPEAPEDFGEVLRHELNNPLTGILGNAELLLAEVRRRHDGRLPQGAQQRLETITELAVRLRETVRRLSQHWEEHHASVRSA